MEERIESYIRNYLSSEFSFNATIQTNFIPLDYVRIIEQNNSLHELVNLQYKKIQLLSKQKDTYGKNGLDLRFTEIKNTFWRLIVGDVSKINPDSERMNKLSVLHKQLSKFNEEISKKSSPDKHNFPGRLLIDVTSTIQAKYLSGIQRVVFEFSKELTGPEVFPVFILQSSVYALDAFNKKLKKIEFKKNDILLMMDAANDYSDEMRDIMDLNSLAGGINIVLVHDIIPIKYPQTCFASIPLKFSKWFELCVKKSDLILCTTQSVVNDISKFVKSNSTSYYAFPPTKCIRLGSDYKLIDNVIITDNIKNIINSNIPIFLSVGTIEPRKGYSIAIDAMEEAWGSGKEFIYVIVGRYGWYQENLRTRILQHNEFNRRLVWLDNLDDSELSYLYSNSRALVYTSIDEGYGLPLVEAAFHGLPAIVSDIPVFREIAGINACYFEVANASMLANEVLNACDTPKKSPAIQAITWHESKTILIEHIHSAISQIIT